MVRHYKKPLFFKIKSLCFYKSSKLCMVKLWNSWHMITSGLSRDVWGTVGWPCVIWWHAECQVCPVCHHGTGAARNTSELLLLDFELIIFELSHWEYFVSRFFSPTPTCCLLLWAMKTWSTGTGLGNEDMQVTQRVWEVTADIRIDLNWVKMAKLLALLLLYFMSGSHCVDQDGLKLMKILLPQPPMSWHLHLLIDQQ